MRKRKRTTCVTSARDDSKVAAIIACFTTMPAVRARASTLAVAQDRQRAVFVAHTRHGTRLQLERTVNVGYVRVLDGHRPARVHSGRAPRMNMGATRAPVQLGHVRPGGTAASYTMQPRQCSRDLAPLFWKGCATTGIR